MRKTPFLAFLLLAQFIVHGQDHLKWYYKCVGHFSAKKYKEALDDIEKAIKLNPSVSPLYSTERGLVKRKLERYTDAWNDFDLALSLGPADAPSDRAIRYFYRGVADIDLDKYPEALKDLNQAILLDPTQGIYYGQRGYIKRKLKNYEEAIKDYDQSIRLEPHSAQHYAMRGFAKCWAGLYREAMEDCDTAISMDPKEAAGYSVKADIFVHQSKYSAAIEACNKAIGLSPDSGQNAIRYDRRGYAYFKSGRYAEAISDFNRAVKLGGTSFQPDYVYVDEAQAALTNTPASPGMNRFINLSWYGPVEDVRKGAYVLTESNELPIHIKVVSNMPLTQSDFFLEINGTPMTGGGKMRVVDLTHDATSPDSYEYDFITSLAVNPGSSRIKLVASVETYKKSSPVLTVNYSPEQINLYVLSIGVASNLAYPQKDAEDFANLFRSQGGEGKLFRQVQVDQLTGPAATGIYIAKKVREWSGRRYGRNDVLLVFISSHGFIDSEGKFRIQGSDFESSLPEKTSTDFRSEVLEPLSWLDCKKFIFLDACRSGGAVAGMKSTTNAAVNKAIRELIEANNGISILASCKDDQESWEDAEWQNGAFTKALREGLMQTPADGNPHGVVRIEDLAAYVRQRVQQLVQAKKGREQTPLWKNYIGNVPIYLR